MVVRDTAGLVVPLALPLLILLSSAGAASGTAVAPGLTALDVYVLPLTIAIVMANVAIVNMPSFLAYYRRSGILRRLAVTPASPALVLVAQAVVSLAQVVVGIALAVAVAFLGLGANPPAAPGATVAVGLLGAAALYATGMVVAAVSPTPNSAVAIGLGVFLALGATGGMFGGPGALPEPVRQIGGVLPFGAAVEALGAAWAGAPVPPGALIGLGAAVVAGAGIASLLFRWD